MWTEANNPAKRPPGRVCRSAAVPATMTLWKSRPMLILASRSPARNALLAGAGLAIRGESSPNRRARRRSEPAGEIALKRSPAASPKPRRWPCPSLRPDAVVIGADQVLDLDRTLLHKPADRGAARGAVAGAARPDACASFRYRAGPGRRHFLVECLDGASSPCGPFETAELDAVLDAEGDDVLGSVGGYRLEGPSIAPVRTHRRRLFHHSGSALVAAAGGPAPIRARDFRRIHVKRAFVIGHPIAHSRSPLIHNYWLKTYGIDGSYEAIDVAPDDLEGVLRAASAQGEFVGGNVTIPHKEMAFALCRRASTTLAETIGAVNTLVVHQRHRQRLQHRLSWAFSATSTRTRRAGTRASKRRSCSAPAAPRAPCSSRSSRAASPRSICSTARSAKPRIWPSNSRARSCRPGCADFAECAPQAGLVVNTTFDRHGGHQLRGSRSGAPAAQRAGDRSRLCAARNPAARRSAGPPGLSTVDGLGMLLHQAVPGFEAWFGVRPEVTPELRRIGRGEPLMLKIGLTGSIATGKSTVLDAFAELGVPVFSSDAAVHELYRGAAVAPVDALFPGVATVGRNRPRRAEPPPRSPSPNGSANSRRWCIRWCAPASRSFSPTPKRAAKRWPWSTSRCCSRAATTTASTASPSPRSMTATQRERALARPGMSVEKLDAILARQMPQAEKLKRADYVFRHRRHRSNETKAKVAALVEALRASPQGIR